jgi:hypothetical protein
LAPAAVVIRGVVRPDVAPLVRAAHLQHAAGAPGQLDEVVGLEHHVVELQERQGLLALQAQLHRVEGEHAVDREVPAIVAQEIDVVEVVQPVGVVDHDRVAGPFAEAEELAKNLLDAGHVLRDLLFAQQGAHLVAPRGVAGLGGAAAHEHDGLVAGVLQPAQQHDRNQVAHVQGIRRAVVADIGRDRSLQGQFVQTRQVRAVLQEPARGDGAKKLGSRLGHWPETCLIPFIG